MTIGVRHVDKNGYIIERFLSLGHVTSIIVVAKTALEDLLATHKLSISRIPGQDYDGASNMQDEFGELKALILRDNSCLFMCIVLIINFNWLY